jgi:hypothetical protein
MSLPRRARADAEVALDEARRARRGRSLKQKATGTAFRLRSRRWLQEQRVQADTPGMENVDRRLMEHWRLLQAVNERDRQELGEPTLALLADVLEHHVQARRDSLPRRGEIIPLEDR